MFYTVSLHWWINKKYMYIKFFTGKLLFTWSWVCNCFKSWSQSNPSTVTWQLIQSILHLSQRITKPTLRFVWPAKKLIRVRICLLQPTDRICLLQPLWYPKRDEREPLQYWIDVQTDLNLCWSQRSYCRICRALAHLCFVSLVTHAQRYRLSQCVTPIITDGFYPKSDLTYILWLYTCL